MAALQKEAAPDCRGGHQLQREDVKVAAMSYDNAIGEVGA